MSAANTIIGHNLAGEEVELVVDKLTWRPGVYAVIHQYGHILTLTNIHTGRYELPGGGIEIAEDMLSAVQREVWEETGLSIRIQQLLDAEDGFFQTPSGKNWHTVKIIYLAEVVSGELRSSILADEWSQNPQWISLESVDVSQFQLGQRALAKALEILKTQVNIINNSIFEYAQAHDGELPQVFSAPTEVIKPPTQLHVRFREFGQQFVRFYKQRLTLIRWIIVIGIMLLMVSFFLQNSSYTDTTPNKLPTTSILARQTALANQKTATSASLPNTLTPKAYSPESEAQLLAYLQNLGEQNLTVQEMLGDRCLLDTATVTVLWVENKDLSFVFSEQIQPQRFTVTIYKLDDLSNWFFYGTATNRIKFIYAMPEEITCYSLE